MSGIIYKVKYIFFKKIKKVFVDDVIFFFDGKILEL